MWDGSALDSVTFARDAGELAGTAAIIDLSRLHDTVFDRSGEIAYRLTGAVNKDGIASLRLEVSGELVLACQRCLGPVKFSLRSVRDFELVPAGQALGDPAEEASDMERIHADPRLDVPGLVEEEIILCLPMVAAHPPGTCSPSLENVGAEEGKSPFSALAALKRQ
jgi:uncharacterized protein